MNNIFLCFKDKKLENQYLNDQFLDTFQQYIRFASVNSICALITFGFFQIRNDGQVFQYWLLTYPIFYTVSYFFIKCYKNLINPTIVFTNVLMTLYMAFLLIEQNDNRFENYLVGSINQLIQYQLFTGTNFTKNVFTYVLNTITYLFINCYYWNQLDYLEIVFILLTIVFIIQQRKIENLRRQYFNFQYTEQFQEQSMAYFQLNVIKCKYDKENLKILFIQRNQNKNKFSCIQTNNQQEFTNFIRQIQLCIEKGEYKQSTHKVQNKITFESLLFLYFTDKYQFNKIYRAIKNNPKVEDGIYNLNFQKAQSEKIHKISFWRSINNGEEQIQIMFQDDQKDTFSKQKNKLHIKQQMKKLKMLHHKMHKTVHDNIVQSLLIIKSQIDTRFAKIVTQYQLYKTIQTSINIMLSLKQHLHIKIDKFNLNFILESIVRNLEQFMKVRKIKFTINNLVQNEILNDYKLIYHLLMNFIINYIDLNGENESQLQLDIEMKNRPCSFQNLQDCLNQKYQEQIDEQIDEKIISFKFMQESFIDEIQYFQCLNKFDSGQQINLGIQQNLRIIEQIGPENQIYIYQEEQLWIQEFEIYYNLEDLRRIIPQNIQNTLKQKNNSVDNHEDPYSCFIKINSDNDFMNY